MSFTDLTTPSHPLDTLVIGAGISGLSLAFTLQQRQTQVLVCESQNRIGGNITTGQADGFLWEEGLEQFRADTRSFKANCRCWIRERHDSCRPALTAFCVQARALASDSHESPGGDWDAVTQLVG
uniref:FAD-dependent oxidoreductase n=1 Tax=Desertifilum tharense IPPAS B-1220 TaxID=1781255 RepID=A0ACD5GQ06_9CYAN